MKNPKVLVACEESQAICKAFRAIGIEAYSCDIQECSGGHPEWHIMDDVLPLLDGRCKFNTSDGLEHEIEGKWDLIIAHPPCTHLAVSGAAHFAKKRQDGRQKEAIEFFMQFMNADCNKIAIENPIGIISGDYIGKYFPDLQKKYGFPIKPSQIIHPWQFGDEFEKSTCLWLKNVPNLEPTKIVGKGEMKEWVDKKTGKIKKQPKWFFDALIDTKNAQERAKIRSRTFPGIAKAIAEQYGKILLEE